MIKLNEDINKDPNLINQTKKWNVFAGICVMMRRDITSFLKYVTQFYTDQALTTTWSPSNWSVSAAWRGYNILAGQDFYPQYDGTNTANVSKLGTDVLQQNYGNASNLLPFRIWAAYFDSNGLKQRATAVPSQIRPT